MATYHLHNWSVGSNNNDPFRAPEQISKRLQGRRCEDDREVVTSAVVEVDGKTITTYSGSVYILEDINPEYLAWMQENGLEYDPENPIKIRKL